MHCINTSHPEFKSLLQETKLHPTILELQIGKWMDANGNYRFPSAREVTALPLGQVYFQANPIRELGLKYNTNTAGFMPFNVDLAQVQRDAIKLGLTVHKAQSGSWFFKDGNGKFVNPHKFRQLESNSSKLPIQELTDKLLAWAETHGISVTTMEEMIKRASATDSYGGSVAVADLLNRIIAIDPTKERMDTLAEEVAHFATAIMREDASVKKAMENIVDTEIYKEVKQEYAGIYTTEAEFRKEAVDKLLTQAILSDFAETTANKGLLAYIKAIFNKFKRWLNGFRKSTAAEEIKKDLYPLAQSILQNDYLGTMNKDNATGSGIFHQRELLYSKEAEEEIVSKIDDSTERAKAKFAIETANKLEDRLAILRTKAKNQRSLARLQEQLEELQNQIRQEEFTGSIMSIISLAKQEMVDVHGLVKKHKANNTTDGNDQDMVKLFAEMYRFLFEGFIEHMERLDFTPEQKTEINVPMREILAQIHLVESENNALIAKHSMSSLDEGNTAPDGSKIDPDFDSKEILEYTTEDANWWRFFTGNYKLSNSGILRSAHKLIYNAATAVKRFAVDKGNQLLQAQVLMEKDGVKVEDLIEKDANGNYTQYIIREEDWASYYQARRDMKSELARVLGFDNFSDIDYKELNKANQNIFKKAFREFNNTHTVKMLDENGNYAGRKPKKKNPKFAELMKNSRVKLYYDLLTSSKREALGKLPLQYRTEAAVYMLPGVRQQFLEKMTDRNKSFLSNVAEVGREAFFIDEDDTQFGEVSALNNRMVPIYFTQRFDDVGNVSRDLTRSFTLFSEMAENFKTMGKLSGDMETIMTQLAKREYKKGKHNVKGIETNDYKILETLVEAHVYGIERKDHTIKMKDTWLTRKLGIVDKHFSTTKLMQKFAKYVSLNNLALNPFTSTAGLLKGTVDSMVEDSVGLYTTVDSKNWARIEYHKNILHVLSQVPKKKQTNKMHLLLQRSNVVELSKMLRNTNKNKLLSDMTSRDLMFINYRTADYAIKGRVALAVYDNTRLVGDQYMTRKRFYELRESEGVNKKEYQAEWKTLRDKSLYNAYEVVDGQLVIKEEFKPYVTDAVENATTGKIEHVSNTVDGTLSDTDKGALARSVYGDFILMHRGWFINMVDSRFMKGKVNMITGESEIGIYPASGKFIWNDIIKGGNLSPWAIYGAYKGITDPAVKRGVKKAALDLMYLQIIGILAAMANVAADDADDDDYLIQYLAYQMNRVLLEQAAGQPLLHPSEILAIIDEPVVGVRTIKDIVDITEAWNMTPYESGMYEGKTHAGKWWRKKIPGYKNLYEAQYPGLKNNFIKNQILSSLTYDLMREKKENEDGGLVARLKALFQDQDVQNEADAVQYVESYEQDI